MSASAVVVKISAAVPAKPAGGAVAVKSRDTIGEFVTLLDTTNGRDKVCRLIQFTAKILKYHAEIQQQPNQKLIDIYQNIFLAMGQTRKALRFFRTIAMLRSVRLTLQSLPAGGLDAPTALSILARLCLANYFFFDNLGFAIKMGIWKPQPALNRRIELLTEGSWLAEMAFTSLEVLIKLNALQATTPQAHAARNALVRVLVRNICDAPVALNILKLTPTSIPDGVFGYLGTFTSLLSLYDSWPTVYHK